MQFPLSDQRRNLLLLQWALVIVTSLLLHLNDLKPFPSSVDAAIVAFLAVTITFSFLPNRYFDKPLFYYAWIFCYILFALLAVSLAEPATPVLYLFFFLVLVVAAAGHSTRFRTFGLFAIGALYVWMIHSAGEFAFSPSLLLQISFLLIVGLFFGYLVQIEVEKKSKWAAPPELSPSLLEFGKTLAQADDLDDLRSNIPTLVHHAMSIDACELVIIQKGTIVRRIFQEQPQKDIPLVEVEKSIHKNACDSKEVHISPAFQQDPNFTQKEDFASYPYQAYMGKSWMHNGQPVGVTAVYRKVTGPWSNADIQRFGFLVDQAVLSLDHVRLLQELESQARTDGLTGLANHRYFYDRLEEELSRAQRQNRPLSVIMMDVDDLKRINDSYGHRAGDEVLRRFAKLLTAISRRMDIAARYGGDEFAVVLPETGAKQAHAFRNRILKEAESVKFEEISEVSISIGSSTFPDDGEMIAHLIEHADQALYQAKSESRRCSREG